MLGDIDSGFNCPLVPKDAIGKNLVYIRPQDVSITFATFTCMGQRETDIVL